MKTIDS